MTGITIYMDEKTFFTLFLNKFYRSSLQVVAGYLVAFRLFLLESAFFVLTLKIFYTYSMHKQMLDFYFTCQQKTGDVFIGYPQVKH